MCAKLQLLLVSCRGPILTWNTGAKLVWELGDEVIVNSIFHGSKNDDWSCVINWEMTNKTTLINT